MGGENQRIPQARQAPDCTKKCGGRIRGGKNLLLDLKPGVRRAYIRTGFRSWSVKRVCTNYGAFVFAARSQYYYQSDHVAQVVFPLTYLPTIRRRDTTLQGETNINDRRIAITWTQLGLVKGRVLSSLPPKGRAAGWSWRKG